MLNFKALGRRVQALRKAKGLTQEKLAEMVDIAPVYMSRIETGASRPSLFLIENLSTVLDIGEEELMFGTPSEDMESKALTDKISALDDKKRKAAEHIIDEISKL